jgi:hypothetical protein
MIRSEIDRRADRTVIPMQFASEFTYEVNDKHTLRCPCSRCERMWQAVRRELER